MLENTFIHVPGIGPGTERRLWQLGILTWEQYLHSRRPLFSPKRDAFVRKNLADSVTNRDDILFFRERLPSVERWRLFDAFKERAVYLDIETSGGYEGPDDITVIGLYDGNTVQTFIHGVNLHAFELAIPSYQVVITFNGALFDLPIIRRHFHYVELPPVHIDLRFLLRKLGYRGGLKAIEKTFAISRSRQIEGMSGYDAVHLWEAYRSGDKGALECLIEYNTADIVNLKPLMERGYQEMRERLLGAAAG